MPVPSKKQSTRAAAPGVGMTMVVLSQDRHAATVRTSTDLGVQVYAIIEHLHRRWFASLTRQRTDDGDRMDAKEAWTARGVRLFIALRTRPRSER